MPGLSLEEFDLTSPALAAAPAPAATPSDLSEGDRLAAYEEGYQAGWDAAAKAQSEDQQRIGAEFARNLQEMSFTFHEARAHVIQAMEPLLEELVNTVLPGLISDAFVSTVQEELRPLIADSADAPVELVVGPGGRAILEGQIEGTAAAAIRLIEEPSLTEGQAYLRIGKTERRIDLSGALDRVRASVSALFELNERTLKHA